MSEGGQDTKYLKPELPKLTPTEASQSLLSYWFNKELKPILAKSIKFPAAIVPEVMLGSGIKALGGFNPVPDIVEGRWGILAAKGTLAGLMAVPFVRAAYDVARPPRA